MNVPVTPANFDTLAALGDDMPDASAIDAVLKISSREQRRRRCHDDAKLDRGEQRLPERHFVAEHQQQAVAASCAEAAQEVCDAIRRRRQFREGPDRLRAVFFDNVQGGTIVAGGDGIEVVERPVEVLLSRPCVNRGRLCRSRSGASGGSRGWRGTRQRPLVVFIV